MDITLHWDKLTSNFVNKERGLSAKHRVGHKPIYRSSTVTLTIERERIDLKWKKMLEAKLIKVMNVIHKDMTVVVFVDKRRFTLSPRNFVTLSNNIAKCIIDSRSVTMDTAIKHHTDKFLFT